MQTITYKMIREKMNGEPYTMELVDQAEADAVAEAVNQGIDAHLEVCNSPECGDSYEVGDRKVGDTIVTRFLGCSVSAESAPTLFRRMKELGDRGNEAAEDLLTSILYSMGFREEELGYGCFEIIAPVDENVEATS